MTRFLFYSLALVLLYPPGIDTYLTGLLRIAQDLGASEAQLHITLSVYLAGMASAILFAGRIAGRSGRKPVAIAGAVIFVVASSPCIQAYASSHLLVGRFIQGIGVGSYYVVAFAILRDTLNNHRHIRVPSLLNGITYIIPVLASVLGHLTMLKYPWQGLFYTMTSMGVMVGLLSVFTLRETRPTALLQTTISQHGGSEPLPNRFFLSRILITTLSVTAILTYVNVSSVLMVEKMGFDRGTYSMVVALMVTINMAVSPSAPFTLSLFTPRTLILTPQVLSLAADLALSFITRQTLTLIGLGMICAGFSVGLSVAMGQVPGPFTLCAGVASSVLGITQVCGSSLWTWFVAIIGLNVMNMLTGILIACSTVNLVLLLVVTPSRVVQCDEEAAVES